MKLEKVIFVLPPSSVYHIVSKLSSVMVILKFGDIFPKYSFMFGELISICGGVFVIKCLRSDSYIVPSELLAKS